MNVILFLVERKKDEEITDPDEKYYHREMTKSNDKIIATLLKTGALNREISLCNAHTIVFN